MSQYTDVDDPNLAQIRTLTTTLGLGPVVDLRPVRGRVSEGVEAVLDEPAPISALQQWTEWLDVLGAGAAGDDYVWLYLGVIDRDLGSIVVTLPLHRRDRAAQAELARKSAWETTHLGASALLGRLAELEGVQ